ncbi:MAG: hypothetical protein HYR56_04305 [Acidobacteria bacterium]|nr:hypothetical protein [Acidobacteriota bacterium]MBI3421744.1 hypothetical protein [Acidobacteriota bacterium]
MNRTSKRVFSGLALVLLTLAAMPNPLATPSAHAQAQVIHAQVSVPVNDILFSTCAGEAIHFTGSYHLRSATTVSANGNFHTGFTANDSDIVGVGLMSGNLYRRVGATHAISNINGPPPLSLTFTNSLNFIGQGQAPNQLLIQNGHITVNANGQLEVFFDHTQLECH